MKKSLKFSSKAYFSKDTEKVLYLINDKHNSFEHVINCLITICEHDSLQAEQCALLAHYTGICEIALGQAQDLIPLQEDLALYGLDVQIL